MAAVTTEQDNTEQDNTGDSVPAAAETPGSASPPWWRPFGMLERGTKTARRVEKQLARQPLARLALAGPRTARWAAETFQNRLDETSHGNPEVKVTPSLIAHVALDESVMLMAMGPKRNPTRSEYERVGADLARARDILDTKGFLDDPASYHQEPPPLVKPASSHGWALGNSYERLSWPSGYEPSPDMPGVTHWNGFEANSTASAWVMRHNDKPRPWVVCIHGFAMGTPFMDLMGFHASHLYNDLGVNLAGIVLPTHGSRRPSPISGEKFLTFDLMNVLHGMSQSLWDIRRLLSWVRLQDPTGIGLMGVSLGGYLTALTAAHEPDLNAAISGIPVANLPDMFRHHSPRHVHERAVEHSVLDEMAEEVLKVVSPLEVDPIVPKDALAIFAGLGDRMAPPGQANKLWEHWDEPDIYWYPGNHIGYLWSKKAWNFVDRKLEERGLTVDA